MQRSVQFS